MQQSLTWLTSEASHDACCAACGLESDPRDQMFGLSERQLHLTTVPKKICMPPLSERWTLRFELCKLAVADNHRNNGYCCGQQRIHCLAEVCIKSSTSAADTPCPLQPFANGFDRSLHQLAPSSQRTHSEFSLAFGTCQR